MFSDTFNDESSSVVSPSYYDDNCRQRIVGRATLVEKIAAQVFSPPCQILSSFFFEFIFSFLFDQIHLCLRPTLISCSSFWPVYIQVFTDQDKARGSGGSGGEYTTQPETSPDTSPVSSPGISLPFFQTPKHSTKMQSHDNDRNCISVQYPEPNHTPVLPPDLCTASWLYSSDLCLLNIMQNLSN